MTGRPDREEWVAEMLDLIVACGVADQLKLRYAYQAHAESISHSDGRRYWERRLAVAMTVALAMHLAGAGRAVVAQSLEDFVDAAEREHLEVAALSGQVALQDLFGDDR